VTTVARHRFALPSTGQYAVAICLPIVAAAGVGYTGWEAHSQSLALALLFPFIWSHELVPKNWTDGLALDLISNPRERIRRR
jgi:hypothetical protein